MEVIAIEVYGASFQKLENDAEIAGIVVGAS